MRWYIPFNQLSLKQRSVLDGIGRQLSRSHWVQGFAGTGKTIVITHLIERVAADHPDASLCFITFTHALTDLVKTGFHRGVAERLSIMTHTQFLKEKCKYDYVFLDEVQDISITDIEKIMQFSGNLYISGDPDQKIYDTDCTETDIEKVVSPVKWGLVEIFRLTPRLREVALSILPQAKIVEGNIAIKKADVTIRLQSFDDEWDEVSHVWEEAKDRSKAGTPSVILLPTHQAIAIFSIKLAKYLGVSPEPRIKYERNERNYSPFNEGWEENDVPFAYLGNGYGSLPDSDRKPMVYIMTYHSSKGLDFENVFIPGLNSNVFIAPTYLRFDYIRRLIFVAVTRSRKNLFLSYNSKEAHSLIAHLPESAITWGEIKETVDEFEEDFF